MEQPDHHRRYRLGFQPAPRPLGGNLVLRPIANVMLGTMASDLRVGAWALERHKNADYDFLDGGRLNAYGLGGSLMLDYELLSLRRISMWSCATRE